MKCKWFVHLVLAVCSAVSAQPWFVHADGKYLVSLDGKRLQLRGTNLGNWLEPEGCTFGLGGGPQSTHEIEGLVNELIGPQEAEKFWQA
jgi:hypothetical protein